MKLLYLLLLLTATTSCSNRAAKEEKPDDPEGMVVVNTIANDTSMVALVDIEGEVGVPDIESLQIRITNRSKEAIAVGESYRISAMEPGGEYRLLFGRKPDAPVLVPAGEERTLTINLELDKIRYFRNTEYVFSTSCRPVDAEGVAVSELFLLFRTPEMWKEGKSITLMPDTMFDHSR